MSQKLIAAEVTVDERRMVADLAQSLASDSHLATFLQLLVEAIARGVDVTALRDDRELTPNKAADLLKVSRPHLLKLMDRGLLAYRKVGSNRRIAMNDLWDYIERHESANGYIRELLATRPQRVEEIKDAAAPLTSGDLDELAALSLEGSSDQF